MRYYITTDNYYTSPQLAIYTVLCEQTEKICHGNLLTKKLKKKKNYWHFKEKSYKWYDKKEICLLSTVHNPEKVLTAKKDKEGNVINRN